MALNRKYSALPDLDTAPDVYETPELTDDNSTVLTTTARSPIDESDTDDGITGISHSHVQVDQARARFLGADVDAQGVDFSDRVDGKRKSYRTTERRRRGGQELGDLSDDDAPDSLERKIARLKREVEEAKEAYIRQKAEKAAAAKPDAASTTETTAAAGLNSLSQLLDDIARFSEKDAAATVATPAPDPEASTDTATVTASATATASTAVVPAAAPITAQAMLVQAADFDRRLALLERSIGIGIGIGSAALPGLDGGALPRAIMPTLETLQRQVTMLADASTASLDGISRRVRALTQEVDELAQSRKAAKAAHEALVQAGVQAGVQTSPQSGSGAGGATPAPAPAAGSATTAAGAGGDPDDQVAKINALYGMLPTIESMTPLLPPLLDRLRSLQTIHADAALASELLDDLEQRQVDTAAEVGQWREGLEKIEAAMREGEATMGKNMQVMDGWVKELEGRLDKVV